MMNYELESLIDKKLRQEFDDLVFNEFCSKVHVDGVELKDSFWLKSTIVSPNRNIKVQCLNREVSFYFSSGINEEKHYLSVSLAAPYQIRTTDFFFLKDFCHLFLPDKMEYLNNWKDSLKYQCHLLVGPLGGLLDKSCNVYIRGNHPRDEESNWWELEGGELKKSFYAAAFENIQLAISKDFYGIEIEAPKGGHDSFDPEKVKLIEDKACLYFLKQFNDRIDCVMFVVDGHIHLSLDHTFSHWNKIDNTMDTERKNLDAYKVKVDADPAIIQELIRKFMRKASTYF